MSKKSDKSLKNDKKSDKKKKTEPKSQPATEALPEAKVYLTPAEWGRVMATAWDDPHFKEALERDPIPAIRERFPTFEFQRVLLIPAPPPGITHAQLERTAAGQEIVIPDVAVGPHIYFHG